MSTIDEKENPLLELAEENGVAIVVSDMEGAELQANNNNSMCATLYYSERFAPSCAEYCGKACSRAHKAGRTIEYRCYAGLDCRAVPLTAGGKQLVAIAGRAFTKSQNYREATERAVTGDWNDFPAHQFFENVLLTGSDSKLLKTSARIERFEESERELLFAQFGKPKRRPKAAKNAVAAPEHETLPTETEEIIKSVLAASGAEAYARDDVTAWRALFGSLLKLDYRTACTAILEFISAKYGFGSLVWLEYRGRSCDERVAIGDLAGRTISLEIDINDAQLLEIINGEGPLVISEERRAGNKKQQHTLSLFPLAVGGEIKSMIGISGVISAELSDEIGRFCRYIASPTEILRLRYEVERREAVSNAVSKFNEALKRLDDADFWQHLTRVSAELLQAERASLLARKEGSAELEIVGSLGLRKDLTPTMEIGSRMALSALDRRSPILVSNAEDLALGPLEAGVHYNTRSFITYPITFAERGLAVLNVTDKVGGGSFDERDLEVLDAIIPQMAVAIDRVSFKEQAGTYAQLSVTDALTNLSNRRYLETRLTEEIQRSSRHGFAMSFLMLDVDEFKSYNDKFGHPAGDEALKLVGLILKDMVRGEDVPARYGGEEFAVLFPQTSIKEAEAIAERIRERVEETVFPYRRVTVSIGLSTYSDDLNTMADIVSAADQALYDAKRSGRNAVSSFGRIDGPSDKIH